MCSAFTPDCGHDNSTMIFIGDVYCPNAKCLDKICLHKKTFQSLGTQNQEGTMEMRDEVLSSVGAQDLDTRSYQ